MAISMVVFWTFSNWRFYQLVAYVWPWKRLELEKVVAERRRVSTIQIMLGAFVFLAYLSARLCLIVQVFITLKKMPFGGFETVNWVAFLPHV
jgi:hypothetical protein